MKTLIQLKSVTPSKMCYSRQYEQSSSSENCLIQYRPGVLECGTEGHRCRSGRPGRNDSDVSRIEQVSLEHSAQSLRAA